MVKLSLIKNGKIGAGGFCFTNIRSHTGLSDDRSPNFDPSDSMTLLEIEVPHAIYS